MRATLLGFLWATLSYAQWVNYPVPGIPRTPGGKPNLSAPAPRTADGKPDLSGVWEHLNSRTTAYYLDGVDIPWRPWAKEIFDQNTADNQKKTRKGIACRAGYRRQTRSTFTRSSRLRP